MPLWVRKLFKKFGTLIVTHSSNSFCRKYINSIDEVCWENNFEPTLKIKKDIIESFIVFSASLNEYFLFNFNRKNDKEKDEFLTDASRTQLQKK